MAKNMYRKAHSASGYLDALAIRAEQLASFLTRRNMPPQVCLERIMNLAEKAQNYVHMKDNNGKLYPESRKYKIEQVNNQREKALARIWKAYEIVQVNEIMNSNAQGKDESWNGAKQDSQTKQWISDPVYFYGDEFEHVVGDELYGYKAQGRTPIRESNYNGDKKGDNNE